jgi:hypothetical protein
MIRISPPAPIQGDIVLLASGIGIFTASPVPAWVTVDSFDLPAISLNQKILVHTELKKSGVSADFISIGTNENVNTACVTTPGTIKIQVLHGWCQTQLQRSIVSGIDYFSMFFAAAGGTTYAIDNASWGNINAAKTININLLYSDTVDAEYSWAAYLIGDGVK